MKKRLAKTSLTVEDVVNFKEGMMLMMGERVEPTVAMSLRV